MKLGNVVYIVLAVIIAFGFVMCCTSKKPVVTYVKNTALHVIKPNWPGNVMLDNHFSNTTEEEVYKFSDILKWQLSKNPQADEKKSDTFRLSVVPNYTFVNTAADEIVWLGHASFYIHVNGKSIVTDPSFFDIPFVSRKASIPCPASDLKPVDYVVVSHNHRDHLDLTSLDMLHQSNSKLVALVPLQMGRIIAHCVAGYEEAGWYQQYSKPEGVRVYLMPAKHWSRRGLFDQNTSLWGSYIIQTDSVTIFFAGDTNFNPDNFKDIASLFPSIDYALLPIGAYRPAFVMKRAHMSPWEAVDACNLLGAKTMVPMHFGTYDLSDEPIGEPYREVLKLKAEGKLKAQLKFLNIGEALLLKH